MHKGVFFFLIMIFPLKSSTCISYLRKLYADPGFFLVKIVGEGVVCCGRLIVVLCPWDLRRVLKD